MPRRFARRLGRAAHTSLAGYAGIEGRRMKVYFRQLGPIAEASYDSSVPLTVGVGPNHSGKTWYAWALEAALREVSRWAFDPPSRFGSAVLGRLADSVSGELEWDPMEVGFRAELQREVEAGLGFEVGARFPYGGTVETTIELPTAAKIPKRIVTGAHWLELTPERLRYHLEGHPAPDWRGVDPWLRRAWAAAVRLYALGSPPDPPEFVGTDRAAVLLFARLVAAAQMGSSSFVSSAGAFESVALGEPTFANVEGLPRQLRAEIARELGRGPASVPPPSPFAELATRLRNDLMPGSLERDERGQLWHTYSPGSTLPIGFSSGAVKALAPILESLAKGTDGTLLIDEPELNLHPAAQRVLVRYLVEAVKLGRPMVLFTHSDWVLRELHRLVLASRLSDERLSDLGLTRVQVLEPGKLAIKLFDKGTCTDLEVGPDGFSFGRIDDALNALQEDEQKLYAALEAES